MSYRDLLTVMRPPVSYDNGDTAAEVNAEAGVFGQFADNADRVGIAPFPGADNDYLYRWEELLAINPPPNAGAQQRTAAILAKLNAMGGLSIAYFQKIAPSTKKTNSVPAQVAREKS